MGNRVAGLADLRRPQIRTRNLWALWQVDYVVGVSTKGGINFRQDDIDIQVVGIMER